MQPNICFLGPTPTWYFDPRGNDPVFHLEYIFASYSDFHKNIGNVRQSNQKYR